MLRKVMALACVAMMLRPMVHQGRSRFPARKFSLVATFRLFQRPYITTRARVLTSTIQSIASICFSSSFSPGAAVFGGLAGQCVVFILIGLKMSPSVFLVVSF